MKFLRILCKSTTLVVVLLSMAFGNQALGTKIYGYAPDGGHELAVLGVFQKSDRISVLVGSYRTIPMGGFPISMLVPQELDIESSIPSILIGEVVREIPQNANLLYANGLDLADYNSSGNNRYIWSMFLGWLRIDNYPTVYSSDKGWLFLLESESDDSIYWIYSFDSNSWTKMDLSRIVFN